MVKLTNELIQNSMQYINPCRDRELDLRGYKIPQIENLGATLDQFDTIDFSDNDVRKLDGFPLLKRLKCMFFNNNRIVRIGEELEQYIPNLEILILTNNNITELGDLDPLSTLPKLKTLSLMHNPVANKQHYRAYVAYKMPELRLLDFRKIKQKERDEANILFKSKKGKELQKEISRKAKTFVPGGNMPDPKVANLKPQEIHKIREAIKNASSLQEVERLTRMLQSGQIPGQKPLQPQSQTNGQQADYEEMETDETVGQ
ncbi:U2 small nuclear ribonucleoprotein A' [Maniola hyperantus]|uniref:U2 small nuclear ribonucleoprotein A' n=1 Tax=Aphantopus hyperantus TaxID=2795564 RepID=UPI00156947C2|nr:U2 small nuclear ribonucleoprotein A' [Maniola hyperantus]